MVNSTKKLIVIKPNGNHSNKLHQNLHFEVFCKKHQIEYHNPTFSDMADWYVKPCNTETNLYLKFLQIDLLGKLFRHSRIVKKIFSIVWILSKFGVLKLVRFDKESELAQAEGKLLKAFENHDVVYVAGWRFRLAELTEKYWDEISANYALNPIYYEDRTLVSRVNDMKSNGYVVVGVHIRRGDYQTWKGGIYCYDDAVYKNQMDSVSKQLIALGKVNHVFVLFSNVEVGFQKAENILVSNEKWFVDHHLMSLCNYLIGPPSTFTLWASYVGRVKLFHLYTSNEQIKI